MIYQDSISTAETFFVEFLTHEALPDSQLHHRLSGKERETVFENHALQVESKDMQVKEIKDSFAAPSWFIGVFILQMVFIGLVMMVFRNQFNLMVSSLFSKTNHEQLLREGNPLKQTYSMLLFLSYGLSMAVFAFSGLHIFVDSIPYNDISLFMYLLLVFLGFPLAKVLAFSFIGNVSGDRNLNNLYITNLIIFDLLLGVIIFPFAFLISYRNYPEIFYLIIIISVTVLFIRGIRGVQLVFNRSSFTSLYIILYLCTLEILPVLLVVIWGLRMTGNLD